MYLCSFFIENQGRITRLFKSIFLTSYLHFIMHIYLISLFPELFESFLTTSLIQKAQEKKILTFSTQNPRAFCTDKHQQIDDQIYWWGDGMLIKAQPIVDCIEDIITKNNLEKSDFSIIFPSPSKEVFNQKIAYWLSKKEHLIFVCWRYEGIDYRCEAYLQKKYHENFRKISIGEFIVLWWETPSMVMIEAITRLIPWVIKEKWSRINESYSIKEGLKNLEAPNYTRPLEVFWMKVPEELLSGNDKEVENRREKNKGTT